MCLLRSAITCNIINPLSSSIARECCATNVVQLIGLWGTCFVRSWIVHSPHAAPIISGLVHVNEFRINSPAVANNNEQHIVVDKSSGTQIGGVQRVFGVNWYFIYNHTNYDNSLGLVVDN